MAKQGKTISKHDVIRAVTSLNMSLNNIVRRIELIEKNLGDYIEMKKDVGDLEKYRIKKKEGNLSWTIRLKKWLKELLSGKAVQK
jgi:hypothetical protein|tara:strand:+ start:148 stop:402 length:255 start_codon:yes stop_codon:yes gene_type:complete